MIDTLGYDASRPIYLPDPVNRRSHLNRSLIAWWKCLPGLDGGRYLYDLLGLDPGVLTGMTTAGSGWGGSPAPGGFGSVRFDGTNDYVNCGSPASLNIPGNITICATFLASSITNGEIVGTYNAAGDNNEQYGFGVGSFTAGTFNWYWDAGASGNRVWKTPASSIAVNTWYRVAATRIGNGVGNAAISINGISQTLTASGTGTTVPTSKGGTAIGREGDFNSGYFSGQLDDIKIYSRALTAAEVLAEYLDSRDYCRATLNRLGGLTAGQRLGLLLARRRALMA